MRTDQISYYKYCDLLPSASLCKTLCEVFIAKYPKVFGIFLTNIYPYKRNDLSSVALPSLMIYPTNQRFLGESWYGKSVLNFDLSFPGGAMIRERSTEISNVMTESISYLILKNQDFFDLLKYGPPNSETGLPTWGKFPALVEIGEKIEVDYSDVNSMVKQHDSVKLTMKVSYTIDTVQWWDYIQDVKGNNVFDPCEFLYPIIAHYNEEMILHSVFTDETQST